MQRSFSTKALVLQSRIFGEDNRIVTFLSSDHGVFDAVLYGGRKSKLRSAVSPFHSGTLWFYDDPSKNLRKIVDFDPVSFRTGLRENLYKTYAASLCAEIIGKTEAGGSTHDLESIWVLVNGFLDGLELCGEQDSVLALLRFLWRFMGTAGIQPDVFSCGNCESPIPGNPEEALVYDDAQECFLCSDCISGSGILQSESSLYRPLCAEGLIYLQCVNSLKPSESRSMVLHASAVSQLRDLLFFLIEKAVGQKLKTFDAARGIL